MSTIDERVAGLEQRQKNTEDDIREIKTQLNQTAKRIDVQELKESIETRDATMIQNMWRLVFVLIGVFTLLIAAIFAINPASLSNLLQ